MKKRKHSAAQSWLVGLVCLVVGTMAWMAEPAMAQNSNDKRPTIGISEVKISPTLLKATQASGKAQSIGRVTEAMDGQLIDRLQSSRKFRVFARSDLDAILKEQNFVASGSVDQDDANAAKSFALKGIKYLLVMTVDDFQDFVEKATFEGTGEQATKRVIRLSAVGKLYDTTTGEILETTNIQLGPNDPDYKKIRDISEKRSYSTTDGNLSDQLLLTASRLMADRMANRVIDVLFPAKIISVIDNQVMINRGDGTDIHKGEVWNVYALGQEMVDPDTGVSLGASEVKVGVVEVTDVQPLFARARVVSDMGVDKGQILRRDNSKKNK